MEPLPAPLPTPTPEKPAGSPAQLTWLAAVDNLAARFSDLKGLGLATDYKIAAEALRVLFDLHKDALAFDAHTAAPANRLILTEASPVPAGPDAPKPARK